MIALEAVLDTLRAVQDPELRQNVVSHQHDSGHPD